MSKKRETSEKRKKKKVKYDVCPECKVREDDSSRKRLYQCPYCGRWFCKKHIEPRLTISLEQIDKEKDRVLREKLYEEWKKPTSHPCWQYTKVFFEKLEKEKEERVNKMIEILDNLKKVKKKPEVKPEPQLWHKPQLWGYGPEYESYEPKVPVENNKKPTKLKIPAIISAIIILTLILGFIGYKTFQGIGANNFASLSIPVKTETISNKVHNMVEKAGGIVESATVEYPHISPDSSYSGYFDKDYRFLYGGDTYHLKLYIDKSIYYGAKEAYKGVTYYDELPSDWENKLYLSMILDPHQYEMYESILRQINQSAKTSDDFVNMAVSFVQQIPYDYAKYMEINLALDTDTRFPIETLVDEEGVCEEKSLLLAGILAKAGYDVVLFDFIPEKHMAVGIRCSCSNDYRDTGYCFIETTSPNPVGDVPKKYLGGVKLESYPKIIKVTDGGKELTNCYYIDEPVSRYSYIIEEEVDNYIESHYGLTYRSDLSSSIDSEYLPYGYESGITYSIDIPSYGNPEMIADEIILCHILDKCDQTTQSSLSEDITRYPYFGTKVECSTSKCVFKILLAKKGTMSSGGYVVRTSWNQNTETGAENSEERPHIYGPGDKRPGRIVWKNGRIVGEYYRPNRIYGENGKIIGEYWKNGRIVGKIIEPVR